MIEDNVKVHSPIGIYIHIPFCIKRCAYCDFSTDLERKGDRSFFLQTLQKEIEASPKYKFDVDSIYFGGGTPSLLMTNEVQAIIQWLKTRFSILDHCEITLEGNPDSLTPSKIYSLMVAGVNRFSVGIQTLNARELNSLGRGHLLSENLQTIQALVESKVRFNIDLMMGIPHQTLSSFQETLDALPIEKISHVSAYLLSIEEESPWFEKVNDGRIVLPLEGMEGQAYYLLKDYLENRGIIQYEISAFARSNEESLHNLKYWENENYIGFGPSSGSYLDRARWQNQKSLKLWKSQINGEIEKFHYEEYDAKNAILETIMLEFRKIKGINERKLKNWAKDYPGLGIEDKIEKLLENKKIEKIDGSLRITRDTLLFANEVFMEFVD